MILSMTGFAVKTIPLLLKDGSSSQLTITVKTLNSRFFETTCKFPYLLSNLENQIIKVLKARLYRGHVYCTMHLSNASALGAQVTPCLKTIECYLKAIEQIKHQFGIAQPVLLDHILRLPNIFDVSDQQLDQAATDLILQAIDDVAVHVLHERMREGKELLKDIERHIAVLEQEMASIEKAAQHLIEAQKEKIRQTMQEIAAGDEQLMAETRKSALFSILDKMDINEEIVRFKSHLRNMITHLMTPPPPPDQLMGARLEKGKQLDFILQELAREINTIAAKCSDAGIGASAINVKVAVEKIREQVQNVV